MRFSKKLKEFREANGISQKEMAEKIGVQQPVYAQYELSGKVPNAYQAVKIAKLIGSTCEYLFAEVD